MFYTISLVVKEKPVRTGAPSRGRGGGGVGGLPKRGRHISKVNYTICQLKPIQNAGFAVLETTDFFQNFSWSVNSHTPLPPPTYYILRMKTLNFEICDHVLQIN